MKSILLSTVLSLACGAAFAALPTVSNVRLAQSGSTVTIRYSLDSAPAIVTCDLEVGGSNVTAEVLANATGDINRKVTTAGEHTVVWKIRNSPFRDLKVENVRVNVKAWSLARPPDYMVADLDNENDIRYYASSNSLPGGLLANEAYRKSKLVMRLIRAKGIPWNMGNAGEAVTWNSGKYRDATAEKIHRVTLDKDYWIGVFEVTQAQWGKFMPAWTPTFRTEGDMRPAESMTYHDVRHTNSEKDNALAYYPADPGDKSYLGYLRTKTGLPFDLPGEAQWEFACSAGTGEGEFNNGWCGNNEYGYDDGASQTKYHTGTGFFPGRIQVNTVVQNLNGIPASVGPTNATAIAGSYEPNAWGLYDMHGNVREMCLDWYAADIAGLNGAVNANGADLADGTAPEEAIRVVRGGFWWAYAPYCRSSARTKSFYATTDENATSWKSSTGFRVICPLEEE